MQEWKSTLLGVILGITSFWSGSRSQNNGIHSQKSDSNHYLEWISHFHYNLGVDSTPNEVIPTMTPKEWISTPLHYTSVARGGGGGGNFPPPPHNAFSEFCRYIWKFVGTCKPTSMPFVPTKYLMYPQNIERNSSFRIWKCKKFLSSLAYT